MLSVAQSPHIAVTAGEAQVTLGTKRRILLATPGSDGNDEEAKVLAHALMEAGFEVIYTGLHQTVEMIVQSAVQEDVDVIGLSVMSGDCIPICRKLLKLLRERDADDIVLIVGGVFPSKDLPALRELGVAAVFPRDSDMDAATASLREQLN
jgi:methylmalonyl-CoA mutase C-terminal domain/subunit